MRVSEREIGWCFKSPDSTVRSNLQKREMTVNMDNKPRKGDQEPWQKQKSAAWSSDASVNPHLHQDMAETGLAPRNTTMRKLAVISTLIGPATFPSNMYMNKQHDSTMSRSISVRQGIYWLSRYKNMELNLSHMKSIQMLIQVVEPINQGDRTQEISI